MEIMTKTSDKATIVKEHLEKATSYGAYRELVSEHAERGTSTGPEQTEALTQYTLLNHSRMKRLDKTVKIPEGVQEKFQHFSGQQTWLVLTESWCGDAAQSMPAMNKLAGLAEHIEFKVLLRDDNPELMNEFLTHGSMSIPKLIVWDHNKAEVVGDWGPRPSVATQMVKDFKEEHGTLTPEFKKDLQVWYNKDKTQNIIEDLAALIA
ncbi:MAG: thioredoxin family protein [Flavobacteriaceae bacterium]|nr:thioredoxin family protein [Flavobacteriaceae bacterium]